MSRYIATGRIAYKRRNTRVVLFRLNGKEVSIHPDGERQVVGLKSARSSVISHARFKCKAVGAGVM